MKNPIIANLIQQNQDFATHLQYLKGRRISLTKQLEQITSSNAYKYWQKLHHIKRNLFNLVYIKQLIPFEWKHQIKALTALVRSSSEKAEQIKFKKFLTGLNVSNETELPITEKVSLIIPAKNAGPEFDIVLKKIISQKYLSQLEIVIVDSGSSDNTVAIAKKYKAKVIKMKPEDFSHSKSRNLGAKHATGKYIIFTVQDAHLLNDSTLNDSIIFLKNNKISACTARQIPRSDTDIFSSWQITNFVNFLSPKKQDLITDISKESFGKLRGIEKRPFCTLDDVFAVYEKVFFDKVGGYNNELTYGEDLEMGKRLIENGYSLGFLYTNGVVHSHNRSAAYFLKRYYVDTVFLYKVFQEEITNYAFCNLKIENLIETFYQLGVELQSDCNSLKIFNFISGDREKDQEIGLESVSSLANLRKTYNQNSTKLEINKLLASELDCFLTQTLKILNNSWSLSSCTTAELISLTDKLFAIFLSGHLAKYYLSIQKATPDVSKLHAFLSQGV